MKCQDLLRALNEYVDGEIDPAICAEFEKHLAGCDPCRVVVDNIRKTIILYKGDQPYELPAEFRARLHRVLEQHWKRVGPSRERAPRKEKER
jgi:anti-sigma factor RsiW